MSVSTEDEREEIAAAKLGDALTLEETQLLFDALGVWASDYNDAPHEAIEKIRARLELIGVVR